MWAILIFIGSRSGEGNVGVVDGDEGDGRAGDDGGEEGGEEEELLWVGRQGVEGVEDDEGF